jgi:transposase
MSTEVPLTVDSALLPQEVRACHALIGQLLDELRKRDARVTDLEHRMDLLLRRLYGRTSEKLDPAQLVLFDTTPEEPVPELPPTPSSASSRSTGGAAKGGHGRRQLPDRLRRVEKIHDLTPAEKESLGGAANLVLIGREETEQLEWEPSSLYVIKHVQLTYARRDAQATPRTTSSTDAMGTAEAAVITAKKPPQPIPGGLPGPGLLAHVATAKFVDHLPLHRQERQFTRHGLFLPRQTTCDWALAGAELLGPLYELAQQIVLASDVLHLDATSVKIRDAQRKLQRTGYFWPCVGDAAHPLVVFHYTPTHTRDGPHEILRDFRGYLQVDAHSVYEELFARRDPATGQPVIVEVGCWMHARRKFFEARTVDRPRAEAALAAIGELYAVERQIAEQLAGAWHELPRAEQCAQVAAVRQERSRPVIERLFPWLEAEAPQLVPKNPVRQAMDYALRQRGALSRYCDDGRLAIDNGVAERTIRGVALGRRNWLFCGSERGARAACVYFSLVTSCRRHEIDPFAYLRDVFTRLPVLLADTAGRPSPEQLRTLLPDRWQPSELLPDCGQLAG